MTYFQNYKITGRKKNDTKKYKYKMNGGREIPPLVRENEERLERVLHEQQVNEQRLRHERELRERHERELRELRERHQRELRERINQAVLDYHARERANSIPFPCIISGGRIKSIFQKKNKSNKNKSKRIKKSKRYSRKYIQK